MPAGIDPEIAAAEMRAAGVEPLEPYQTTKTSWRSRCLACGSIVHPRLGNIRTGQGACGYCAGVAPIDPARAKVEMVAAGVDPIEPYTSIGNPWRCRCRSCNNEVSPSLNNIRRGQGSCKYCANRVPVDPAVAAADMRAAGVEPIEPYRTSADPWLSRCLTCDSEVSPTLGNIRSGHAGCMYCAGAAPLDPEVAIERMRERDLEPLEPYKSSNSPWRCRCLTCGNEVMPRLGDLRRQGGCKYCAGNTPISAEKAIADMRAAGVEPLEPYKNNHAPWRSRCLTCGRIVTPSRANATHVRGWGPCRYCAVTGYDPSKPGDLYLVVHDQLEAVKVGITAAIYTDRVAAHERNGWRVAKVWNFDDGSEALEIEERVLAAWSGFPYGVDVAEMPQRGYTETVRLEDVSEPDAISAVETAISRWHVADRQT